MNEQISYPGDNDSLDGEGCREGPDVRSAAGALAFMLSLTVHDLAVALQTLGNCHRLLALEAGTTRQQTAIRQGKRSLDRADMLLGRLRTLGQRESASPATIVVQNVLQDLHQLICAMLPSAIYCEVDGSGAAGCLQVNQLDLEVVFVNLAANAQAAMPDGGRIVLSARRSRASELGALALEKIEYVVLGLQDGGVGMSPEVLKRCVEPFFTTKGAAGGLGLGLAGASEFARRAGGRLRIESAVGEGTLVEIFLPLVPDSQSSK